MTSPESTRHTAISRRLVLLLAVACGTAVANNYYAQPLLDVIARRLGVGDAVAGLLVTAGQAGYVAGLLFIVPLGDLVQRRRLVTAASCVTAVGLAVAAAAPSFAVLAAATAVFGVTSVVAQILVPFSADLAGEEERGRVVGTVMSGLLVGILTARTVAGLIAGAFGWRAVYAVAAGITALLAAILWRALPAIPPRTDLTYRDLLRSIAALVREEPVLRRRSLYGATTFASFGAFWTSLAFLLSRPPFDYGTSVIGLFGLAGLAGALAASFAGRLHDRGLSRPATGAFALLCVVAWIPLAAARHSVAGLLAGALVLDLGIQGVHILNQSRIYALRPDARSRLTTAYMTSYFLGGAAGSALSALAWSSGGWLAVCAVGAAFPLIGLLVWAGERTTVRAAHGSRGG
jgi:predicted MFS family arabinose efflux permease